MRFIYYNEALEIAQIFLEIPCEVLCVQAFFFFLIKRKNLCRIKKINVDNDNAGKDENYIERKNFIN